MDANAQDLWAFRMNSELIAKLDRNTATIGIVGLGYVGLPLMLRYCEVGYKIVGFDRPNQGGRPQGREIRINI